MNTEGFAFGTSNSGQFVLQELVPGSPSGGAVGGVIYRPGAASSGMFVATWAEVQAVVAAFSGCCIVWVDDGIVTPALVPASTGVTDFQGRGEIRPYRVDDDNYATLVVEDGATLKALAALRGLILVVGDTQGATPAIDFDFTTSPSGLTPWPALILAEGAFVGSFSTATAPIMQIPSGTTVFIVSSYGGIDAESATAPIANLATNAGFVIQMTGQAYFFTTLASWPSSTWLTFAGTAAAELEYASNVVLNSGGPEAFPGPLAGLTFVQADTQAWEFSFTAPATNVLASIIADGYLPFVGTLHVDAEGFGGTGGGAGGTGGTNAAAGLGGGGSGGAILERGGFDFDLSHSLTVGVGAGGLGGAGGAAGGGAGADGQAATPTTFVDATSNVTLLVFGASQQGSASGHGGSSIQGAFVPNSTDLLAGYGAGFVAAGGKGGLAGVAGTSGQPTRVQALIPGALSWAPGAGGTSSAGEGGGGGGGGAGVLAPAGAGGNSAAAGSPGGNGTSVAPNSGAGAGGGAGGASNTDAGGNGGNGSSGLARLRILVPAGATAP